MNVLQKLTDEQYDKLYVTSDTHFNHNKEFVYKARGYTNPQEMTDDIINIINDTVGQDGILLHLGDFCLNTSPEEYKDILRKLKIKELWMLFGNHNSCVQQTYGGTREQVCSWNQGMYIRYLGYYYTFSKGKKDFVCSHFPFQSWDSKNNGSMHIHGHCHNNLISSHEDNKNSKILDVGWDAYPKPLHITEIVKIMNTKNIDKFEE